MANFHLVFIPSPGIGHLFSAVEFAKKLVSHDERLSITVFVMNFPFDNEKKLPFSSMPRIRFVHLKLELLDMEVLASKPPGEAFEYVFRINKHRVRDYVFTEVDHLSAFVVDMFCVQFIDLANEFDVPTYAYFTSSAGFLSLSFHLQVLVDEYNQDLSEFIDSDAELNVNGFSNFVPARVLPADVINNRNGFPDFMNIPRKLREIKGILVNTFEDLECKLIKSFVKASQIYAVGPLLATITKNDKPNDHDLDKTRQYVDIMTWLDEQPPCSVVLLCFGSRGSFENEQVVEIANALEHSGYRFLWALRCPPPKEKIAIPTDYENLENVLPEGFLERISELGKVVGWVPQLEILSHPSTGGFVSHCGWNSTLESLWCGVPIATWPLYAEQKINAFELVKELGLAIEITMDYNRDTIISSDEIERGIRLLMDDKDCLGVRQKVKEISKKSKASVEMGGSSYNAVKRFIEDLTSN